MTVSKFETALAVVFACSSPAIFAQEQPPTFVRDICLKVLDGKQQDFQVYLRDVSVKLAQMRVNDRRFLWWGAERAVVPAGDSAPCDYHIVSAHAGFPAEAPDDKQLAADYERAKLSISPDDAARRRDAASRLIGVNIWRMVGGVGDPVKEGSYVRRNFYKARPGHTMGDWVKLETTGWMQFAEALAKERPGWGWAAVGLVMPGGTKLPYQGMTVDVFPDWKSLGLGVPADTLWPKVHPELSWDDYLNKVNDTVDRVSTELYRMVHFVTNENQASRTAEK